MNYILNVFDESKQTQIEESFCIVAEKCNIYVDLHNLLHRFADYYVDLEMIT